MPPSGEGPTADDMRRMQLGMTVGMWIGTGAIAIASVLFGALGYPWGWWLLIAAGITLVLAILLQLRLNQWRRSDRSEMS